MLTQQPLTLPRNRWLLLATLSLLVWAIESLVVVPVLRGASDGKATLLAWAIVFDCALVPALVAYALIVRPGRRSALATLLPIIVLGLTVTAFVLPPEHRTPLHMLRFVIAPLELAVLGGALWRFGGAFRRSRGALLVERDFDARLLASLPADASPALRLVAAELTLWHYGLFAWRTPTPPEDDATFAIGGETAGLLPALILLTVLEGGAEHLLLWRWNPRVDLALLAVSAYGLLYLVAEINALRLRPLRLTDDGLQIRTGLRWQIDVPYRTIGEIRPVASHARRKPVGYVNAVGFGKPNLRLHLTEPVEATGPFGIRRAARYIALKVDRPDPFCAAVTARISSKTRNENA